MSFYRQGEFIDLCRGPHIPHAGKVGAFKLLSIAGAYWKGDASRKQLQRLYGTAFFDAKSDGGVPEAGRRSEEAGPPRPGQNLEVVHDFANCWPGDDFVDARGATLRHLLEGFIREELVKRGYQPVYTPHIGNLNMYRTSGHFPYYADAQFPAMYMNPLVQTVDTWSTLADKELLTPDQEAAFLAVREQYRRRQPAGDARGGLAALQLRTDEGRRPGIVEAVSPLRQRRKRNVKP